MKKIGTVVVVLAALAAGLFMSGRARAGSLDAPAGPTSSDSAMFTLEDIYNVLDTRTTNVAKRVGGFTEPTAGPTNGTMHTLDDIMALVTNRAPTQKTGYTNTYAVGDDGTNRFGVAWPVPRFSPVATNGAETNQIRDNLTGLIWTKNANLANGTVWSVNGTCTWSTAFNVITNSAGPVNGANYGGTNDWRLPNIRELYSLVDFGNSSPCLPSGHPFTSVQPSRYWSSTSYKLDGGSAFAADLSSPGLLGTYSKANTQYVWPVRGGH